MSPGFALLRSPQVIQTQILNMCKPHEVFILSLCSKRAYNLTKVHRKKPEKGELTVTECGFSCLLISYYDETLYENTVNGIPMSMLMAYLDISEMPEKTEIIKIGNIKVPAKLKRIGLLVTYWEDRVYGIKTVTDYVTRLFNKTIDVIQINKSLLWMIDWINSRQEPIKEADIYEREAVLSEEEFLHILTNCKPTDELYLSAYAPANFRFTGQFQKYNVLRVVHGQWVTLNNLKSMDSIEIYLLKTLFTSSDMNLFLKHWLAGGSPRLSYARIDMFFGIRFDDVFKDLTEKTVRVPGNKEFKFLNGEVHSFEDMYEIEREDGAKASIRLQYIGESDFHFFVCPATEIIN